MKAIKLLLVMLASLVVVACGGGGGSSPAATTLSGNAAVGAPIVGATIDVKCAAGTALSNIPVTSATGAWSVTLSGQTLPCAVQVSGGTIRGTANTTTYQSIANAYGVVNVTPLTDLLVANLAGSASATFTPAQLAAITPANIATALTNLRTALALSALNTIDPITTAFTPTGGVPMDDILSALQTAMTNSGTSYASLLTSAASATFTTPANFKAALTAAYSIMGSGTAAQYFSKKAVGNTWTWFDTSSNSTASSSRAFTITASAGNVVTVATSKNGGTPSASTLRFDATGAWVFTSGTYSTVILPATFSVGTSWVAEPADPAAGISATTDTVAAFNVTRTVPAGTFTDCVQVNSTYTYTYTQQPSGFITTYNSTRYYSPTAGMYVDGFSSDSNGSTGTEQLQAGYIANP